MGIILDSSVLIAAERRRISVRQALEEVSNKFPDDDIALSAITISELMHGVARASSVQRRNLRLRFIDQLIATLAVHPITISIAMRAGRLDGESAAKGFRLALADLLIGSTALDLEYRIATGNLRHFGMIPGLTVLPF